MTKVLRITKEEVLKKMIFDTLKFNVVTQYILYEDNKVHPILLEKVINLIVGLNAKLTKKEEKFTQLQISSQWKILKEKNSEWADFYSNKTKVFLTTATKEETYSYLSGLKLPSLLSRYIKSGIIRDQVNVVDYAINNNVLSLDIKTFKTAIEFRSLNIINYFMNKGFDIKLNENKVLESAILSKEEEIQKFFIDNGCSTKDLPITDGDAWIRSYERSKNLQEKLSEKLDHKKSQRKSKI